MIIIQSKENKFRNSTEITFDWQKLVTFNLKIRTLIIDYKKNFEPKCAKILPMIFCRNPPIKSRTNTEISINSPKVYKGFQLHRILTLHFP